MWSFAFQSLSGAAPFPRDGSVNPVGQARVVLPKEHWILISGTSQAPFPCHNISIHHPLVWLWRNKGSLEVLLGGGNVWLKFWFNGQIVILFDKEHGKENFLEMPLSPCRGRPRPELCHKLWKSRTSFPACHPAALLGGRTPPAPSHPLEIPFF